MFLYVHFRIDFVDLLYSKVEGFLYQKERMVPQSLPNAVLERVNKSPSSRCCSEAWTLMIGMVGCPYWISSQTVVFKQFKDFQVYGHLLQMLVSSLLFNRFRSNFVWFQRSGNTFERATHFGLSILSNTKIFNCQNHIISGIFENSNFQKSLFWTVLTLSKLLEASKQVFESIQIFGASAHKLENPWIVWKQPSEMDIAPSNHSYH